jgi:hypothetical protein
MDNNDANIGEKGHLNIVKRDNKIAKAALNCMLLSVGSFLLMFVMEMLIVLVPLIPLAIMASIIFMALSFMLSIAAFIYHYASKDVVAGTGRALISIVVSILFFLMAFMVWQSNQGRKYASELARRHFIENIAKLTLKYVDNNHGILPMADTWTDELIANGGFNSNRIFRDTVFEEYECGYAFNDNISGMKPSELPGNIVMYFEAGGHLNQHGSGELLDSWKGKRKYIYVVQIDKTVKKYWYDAKDFDNRTDGEIENVDTLRWKP